MKVDQSGQEQADEQKSNPGLLRSNKAPLPEKVCKTYRLQHPQAIYLPSPVFQELSLCAFIWNGSVATAVLTRLILHPPWDYTARSQAALMSITLYIKQ